MAGAKPEVDGARAGPEGTAETAKYAKHEKKKTRTSTRRARARAGSEWECHVEIEWIGAQLLTPHFGGLSAGRGAGGWSSKTATEESRELI